VKYDVEEARRSIEKMDTRLRAARDAEEAEHRARIIERVIELRAEVQSQFDMIAHWNEHVRKPHEEPIDPDPDGLLGLLLQKLDAQIKAWVQ
jgi:hypothetical protein